MLLLGIGGILGTVAAAFYTPLIGDLLQTYIWKRRHRNAFYRELLFIWSLTRYWIQNADRTTTASGVVFHVPAGGTQPSKGDWQCLLTDSKKPDEYLIRLNQLQIALDNIKQLQSGTLREQIVEKGTPDSLKNFYQLKDSTYIDLIYRNFKFPFAYAQTLTQSAATKASSLPIRKKQQSDLFSTEMHFQDLKEYCNGFGNALRKLSHQKLLKKINKSQQLLIPFRNPITSKLDTLYDYDQKWYIVGYAFSQVPLYYRKWWHIPKASYAYGEAYRYPIRKKWWQFWRTDTELSGVYRGIVFRDRSKDSETTDSTHSRSGGDKEPFIQYIWMEVVEGDFLGHLIKKVTKSDLRTQKQALKRMKWWISSNRMEAGFIFNEVSEEVKTAQNETKEDWWIANDTGTESGDYKYKVIIHLKKPKSGHRQVYGTDVVLEDEHLDDKFVITAVKRLSLNFWKENLAG